METSPESKPFVDAVNRSPLRDKMVDKLARPLKTEGEIKPTDMCVAVAPDKRGRRTAFPMIWGFTGKQSVLFTAKIESAAKEPMWKESLERRRCIIPASWYYEWVHLKSLDGKIKFGDRYIIQPDGATLTLLAGVYRMEELESTGMSFPHFSILTREASKELRFIYDRMPVILDAESAAAWINPAADLDMIKAIAGKALMRMVFENLRRGSTLFFILFTERRPFSDQAPLKNILNAP